jgi:hypothetical protein
MSDPSDKPTILAPGTMQLGSGTMTESERRLAIRYPFTAATEVIELRSQLRIIGRTADLGPAGCYVDTLAPLPVGAVVRVRMVRDLRTFEAAAAVVYSASSLGMGLAFTKIEPEHQKVLQAWMAELTGDPLPEPEVLDSGREAGPLSAVLNLQHVLNELINLMIRNKIINPDEGAALLRRMFR